ncbi:MAG: efflux RND transporter periplasmic adaptor subunit [Candidatus Zixiibacteriota bacterium]
MKKVFSMILIMVFIFACDQDTGEKEIENQGKVFVQAEEISLQRISSTLDFSGILEPVQSARLSTQLSAQVSSIEVEEGDKVRQGQVLARMSAANLDQAKAQLSAIESEWERVKTLYDAGSVSKAAYDRAKSQYDATMAAFDMAKDNTIIKAPFSGEILDIGAKEDEIFSPMMAGAAGATYVVHVINNDTLKMEIKIPDRHIAKIEKDGRVFFTSDATEDTLEGFIFQVNKSADPKSGAFSATLYLPNQEQNIPSGVYAKAHIIIANNDSALVVDQSAIIGDSLVFKVISGKSKAVKIHTGIQTNQRAQIISDNIKPGDTIITHGNVGLKNDIEVRITE